MAEINNETFVRCMKEAWQNAEDYERDNLFNVLEEMVGTDAAIDLRSVMQESL